MVGELVRAALAWSRVSPSSAGVSRATLDRVKRGDQVSETMLRALGDALGLPRDFLLYVGAGDVANVVRSASDDRDLCRWTLTMLTGRGVDGAGEALGRLFPVPVQTVGG
jgi:hypothetical protein